MMGAPAAGKNASLDYKRLLLDLLQEIPKTESIEAACFKFDGFVRKLNGQLLSVKFYDIRHEAPEIRPFSAYPQKVRRFRGMFDDIGGCPLNREAVKRLRPFSLASIDRSLYRGLHERRLLDEIEKVGHKTIAIVPVVIGRGVAIITIGLHNQAFEGRLRMSVSDSVSHVVAAVMARFPEIATLFNKKVLSEIERKVLSLACQGKSSNSIGTILGLGPVTANAIFASASKKLNASNVPETIFRAISLGEISQSPPAAILHRETRGEHV